jgi:RNA polymerase sigma-70 factor (ECF subfamily)
MASNIQEAKIAGLTAYLPGATEARVETYKKAYEENHYRVYALAFWMTDNEMVAEELMSATFCRAFASSPAPDSETIDRALMVELREMMAIGTLTLECSPSNEICNVRRNTKRVDLERALVQLPVTERLIFLMHDVEGYDHDRIARTIGVTDKESAQAVHQARLRLRELLASKA